MRMIGMTENRSVVTELFRGGPYAVHLHVEPTRHPLTPLRARGRFAPVVGDAHDLTVLELTNGDVPIQRPSP